MVRTLQREKYNLIEKYEESEQQLHDSRSDLRLLREQIVRQRVGSLNEGLANFSRAESSPHHQAPSAQSTQREDLIKEIELLREQRLTIENDLKLALCQKEELEIERDSFKIKYNKLNEFLIESSRPLYPNSSNDFNSAIKDVEEIDKNNNTKRLDSKRTQISLNVDELLSQNKYLKESNQNLIEEIDLLKSSIKKSKQTSTEFKVVNKKQVEALLSKSEQLVSEHQMGSPSLGYSGCVDLINELKKLVESLLENLNDRLTANVHQKKVNKMLATRIQDLEAQAEVYIRQGNDQIGFESIKIPEPCSSSSPMSTSAHLSLLKPLVPEQRTMLPQGNNFSSEGQARSQNLRNNINNSSYLIRFDEDQSQFKN